MRIINFIKNNFNFMSMIYCEHCGRLVDTDFNAEHEEECLESKQEEASADYPLGGSLEPYDIERDKNLLD